jgi:hypothetical protein
LLTPHKITTVTYWLIFQFSTYFLCLRGRMTEESRLDEAVVDPLPEDDDDDESLVLLFMGVTGRGGGGVTGRGGGGVASFSL